MKNCPKCKVIVYPIRGNIERKKKRNIYILIDVSFYRCIKCEKYFFTDEDEVAIESYINKFKGKEIPFHIHRKQIFGAESLWLK